MNEYVAATDFRGFKRGSVLIILAAIMATISGCRGDELTRSEAKRLIVESEGYPKEITEILTLGDSYVGGVHVTNAIRRAEQLNESGLGKAKVYRDKDSKTRESKELTEEGSKFVRRKTAREELVDADIVIYTRQFGEVTGITYVNGQKTAARVEYTEKYEASPFAPILSSGGRPEVVRRKAEFRLYDDGWRTE